MDKVLCCSHISVKKEKGDLFFTAQGDDGENNQEIQEQDQTTEALLSSRRNKYKKDLDKDETDDTTTVSEHLMKMLSTEEPVDAEEDV